MPGLFAGLGISASTQNENAGDKERKDSSNINRGNMSSEKPEADKDTPETILPVQVGARPAQGSGDASGLGLFAGLVSQPPVAPQAPPQQESQPVSAFNFMSVAPVSAPESSQGGKMDYGERRELEEDPTVGSTAQEAMKPASSGLSGLGLFAGMDLPSGGAKMQTEAPYDADKANLSTTGSERKNPNEIIGISTDPKNSHKAVEISIIDNENGDTSKNQISFEEMHLNIGGGNSASGPAEGGSAGILEGVSARHDARSSPRGEHDEEPMDSSMNRQEGAARPLDLFGLMGSST